MRRRKQCVVYWLHDASCVCLWRHGYIGISTTLSARLRQHRNDKRKGKSVSAVPTTFDCQILFRGSTAKCVALENQLRPTQDIGWNSARGGRQPYLGYKHSDEIKQLLSQQRKARGGIPHSAETCAKLSAIAVARYANPAERAKAAARTKAAGRDQSGASNGNFGKHLSEEERERVRVAAMAADKRRCAYGHIKDHPKKPCRECGRLAVARWRKLRKSNLDNRKDYHGRTTAIA